MRSLLIPFMLMLVMLPAAALSAQTAEADAQENPRAVERRYIAESDAWRLAFVEFVFRGDMAKYREAESAMQQFTPVTASYIVYKRPGERLALNLYYRNLENIAKINQLRQAVESMQRDYPEHTKDFFTKYEVAIADFETFDKFEPVYERVMNRWRVEFENAMKGRDVSALVNLREDMKILQQSITVFVLLPGRSATKVPQLQTMENDLRHSIVMLRMYEQTTQAELDAERQQPG